MHIQTVNYEEGLTGASILSFISLFTFFLLFFYALTSLNDYFTQIKKTKSSEDLNELERKVLKITKQNTKINSQKIIVDSPMLPKKKKSASQGKTVLIQEQINKYYYINVNLQPSKN